MIKATIGELSSPGLQMALQKLNGAQVSTKIAYRFKKLNDALEVTMKKVRSDYDSEIVKNFGKKDEKDQLIPAQVPWGFELLEGVSQEDFDKANEEFHKREVTIDRLPLTIMDLNDVKISAAEMSALGKFFVDPEDAQEDGSNVAQIRR